MKHWRLVISRANFGALLSYSKQKFRLLDF